MIYVTLDVYKAEHYDYTKRKRRTVPHYEERLTRGPYLGLYRGYEGEVKGRKPDGLEEVVFEAAVGSGGYCDTCAYTYPSFQVSLPDPLYDVEVKHFEIVVREE